MKEGLLLCDLVTGIYVCSMDGGNLFLGMNGICRGSKGRDF